MLGKKVNSVSFTSTTNIDTLKAKLRILIIDDNENDLISALRDHHWNVRYQPDLLNIDDPDVRDSQIILVDVKGIGKKLGFKDEGLDVAVFLKERYTEKKIVLYSTIEEQKAFHKAFRIADKVIYKDGSIAPFLSTIEDLARQVGDWEPMIKYIYDVLLIKNGYQMDFSEFSKKMQSIAVDDRANSGAIERILGISANVATIVFGVLSLFFGAK